MPTGPAGNFFLPEYNVKVLALKFIEAISRGCKNQWKNILHEKKNTWLKSDKKSLVVLLAKNFDRNTLLAFLLEKL